MKAVILSINPAARIMDITHSVPPQDIEAAGFALVVSYRYLPAGSVVVVVVDPGVGGKRSILCAESGERLFLFPDNGVLTELLDREGYERLVKVEHREFFLEPVSRTFHGRDIFAPVAAHLSLGVEMDRLGSQVIGCERTAISGPEVSGDSLAVRIRWIDRFGNLITDCPADLLAKVSEKWGGAVIDLGAGATARVAAAYEDVDPGRPLGIIGSSGYLEISISGGSATQDLGIMLGDTVRVRKP
jgi:S-adenosylmethionine hydrolase